MLQYSFEAQSVFVAHSEPTELNEAAPVPLLLEDLPPPLLSKREQLVMRIDANVMNIKFLHI